jgi:hypothetical protein
MYVLDRVTQTCVRTNYGYSREDKSSESENFEMIEVKTGRDRFMVLTK